MSGKLAPDIVVKFAWADDGGVLAIAAPQSPAAAEWMVWNAMPLAAKPIEMLPHIQQARQEGLWVRA